MLSLLAMEAAVASVAAYYYHRQADSLGEFYVDSVGRRRYDDVRILIIFLSLHYSCMSSRIQLIDLLICEVFV